MQQFEVIEHRDDKVKNQHIVYCINYVDPTFIEGDVDTPLEKGDLVLNCISSQ